MIPAPSLTQKLHCKGNKKNVAGLFSDEICKNGFVQVCSLFTIKEFSLADITDREPGEEFRRRVKFEVDY